MHSSSGPSRLSLRRILAAPVFEGDDHKTRVAALLNLFLLACLAAALVAGVIAPVVYDEPTIPLIITGSLFLLTLLTLALMRLGRVRAAGALILSGLWISTTVLMFLSDGVNSIFAVGYVTLTVMAGLLLEGRAAIAVAELSLLAGLGLFYAERRGILPDPMLGTGLASAWLNLTANLAATVVLLYLAIRSLGEALDRARRSAAELGLQRELLEQLVSERTRDLEHRVLQLRTAAEVGRAAASMLELGTLTRQVVELVRERFDLYYVGLYLLDEAGQFAVLEAGSGEAGRVMKERGHQLGVGGMSMVGAACAQRQVRIALDVPNVADRGRPGEGSARGSGDARSPAVHAVRFDNPLLPRTRSEMALPLMVGDRVLGALDVQSTEPAVFSEEDIAVLQLVADQVAVAVDNALKFSQEAELLEATSPLFRVSRRLVSAGTTAEIVQAIVTTVAETEADGCVVGRLGRSSAGEVERVTVLGDWDRHGASRFSTGETLEATASPFPSQMVTRFWVIEDVTREAQAPAGLRSFLARCGPPDGCRAIVNLPLRVGDQAMGFVSIYRAGAGPFSPVSIRLYETLVDQAAVAMERQRLLDEAQERAAREHLISQAAARMREALDVETVLKTAVEEISSVMGLAALEVRLGMEATDGAERPHPNRG